MNIIGIPPKTYSRVYTKAMAMHSMNATGLEACFTLQELSPTQIKEWVETLAQVNWECYSNRYHKDMPWPVSDIEFDRNGLKVDTYQFLKYLHSISYNIETDYLDEFSEDDQMHLDLLEKVIHDIEENIVNSLPEYQKAQWICE